MKVDNGMEVILNALKDAALNLREAKREKKDADIKLLQAQDRYAQAMKDCGIDSE